VSIEVVRYKAVDDQVTGAGTPVSIGVSTNDIGFSYYTRLSASTPQPSTAAWPSTTTAVLPRPLSTHPHRASSVPTPSSTPSMTAPDIATVMAIIDAQRRSAWP
jgi:hypothetical protein